jgi:hypothetical protein
MMMLRNHIHAAAINDFPVPDLKDPAQREMRFRLNYGYNILTARELLRLRASHVPEIALYLPVQAYRFRHFDHYLSDLGIRGRSAPFEGVCLPVRIFDNPVKVGLWALKISQSTTIQRLHIFGTHAFWAIAVAAGLCNLFPIVSLDSSSYFEYSRFSLYLLKDLTYIRITEKQVYDDTRCTCSVCTHISLNQLKYEEPKYRAKFLELHNFTMINDLFHYVSRHNRSPYELKQALLKISGRVAEIDAIYNTLAAVEAFKNIPVGDDFLEKLYDELYGRRSR